MRATVLTGCNLAQRTQAVALGGGLGARVEDCARDLPAAAEHWLNPPDSVMHANGNGRGLRCAEAVGAVVR